MKNYLVTIFDKLATRENPVEPVTVLVSSDHLGDCVNHYVDENHTMMISSVSAFEAEHLGPSVFSGDND